MLLHARVFVKAFVPLFSSFLPCFPGTFRPLLIPSNRRKPIVESETRKAFCGYISHHLFTAIRAVLHGGPRGRAEEHSLHYLVGQSLRNPCVFGPEEHKMLKISAWVTALFVSSVISLNMLISETAGSAVKAQMSIQEPSVLSQVCSWLMSEREKTIIRERIVRSALLDGSARLSPSAFLSFRPQLINQFLNM